MACSTGTKSRVQPCWSVVELRRASTAKVECSRVKQSHSIQQSLVQARRAMVECSRVMYRQVDKWQGVVEQNRAQQMRGRVQHSQVEEVESWQSVVELSRSKQSQGRVWQSQVEGSRAMVECSTVKQRQLEPRQSVVELHRSKQSNGRVCRVKQIQVQPWQGRQRLFSKCTPLHCKIKPFQRCRPITFQLRPQSLPTLQYNNQFMWKTDYTDQTAGLAFVACSSPFENLHYQLRTEPSHLTAKIYIVYFN